jgi:hypothetical protein
MTFWRYFKYKLSGHGGIGRRAGFRIQWFTAVWVQVPLSAPKEIKGFRGFPRSFLLIEKFTSTLDTFIAAITVF